MGSLRRGGAILPGMSLHPAEPEDAAPPVRRVDALIGETPVIRIHAPLAQPGMAEVWLKLERFQPAGSHKDRTAVGLVADAEQRDVLRPGEGHAIVEASSGNLGVALAFLSAVRGYRCTIVLPEAANAAHVAAIRAYGARVTRVEGDPGMLGAIARAAELADATSAWTPSQFDNPANPRTHQAVTGPELWAQMQGRIDAFVAATGTGGTISGVGRYLKSRDAKVRIVAVEPAAGTHAIVGAGPGFVPANLDVDLLDDVVAVADEDALGWAARSLREAGISLGPSAGATLHAALRVARELGPGKVVVGLASDGAERYLAASLGADRSVDRSVDRS